MPAFQISMIVIERRAYETTFTGNFTGSGNVGRLSFDFFRCIAGQIPGPQLSLTNVRLIAAWRDCGLFHFALEENP
jgi:hypothetical protein